MEDEKKDRLPDEEETRTFETELPVEKSDSDETDTDYPKTKA